MNTILARPVTPPQKDPRSGTFRIWLMRTATPICLALAICAQAHAASLTWDSSGTSPASPVGGNGTWNTSSTNWSDGTQDLQWNNSADNSATFQWATGSGATVTLGENISANSLVFKSGGSFTYRIEGAGYTLSLSGGSITADRATEINANISGANGLTKLGSSTLRLFAQSSYAGNTSVQSGVLQIRATNALPTSTSVSVSGGASVDVRSNQTLAGISGSGTITQSSGSSTLTVNATAANSAFSGVIQNGISLVKSGDQSLVLTGTNTYTGSTAVNAGSLIIGVAGSGSITSNVTVNSGALLGGSGSTSGNVAVAAGGKIAPGDSAGTFVIGGTLSLATDSVYQFELDGSAATADKIVANGITISAGADFSFSLLGGTSGLNIGDTFTLLDNSASGDIGGTFGNLDAGGSFDAGGGLIFSVSGNNGSYGNDLVLEVTAVPEPSAAPIVLGALAAILASRRIRSSSRQ